MPDCFYCEKNHSSFDAPAGCSNPSNSGNAESKVEKARKKPRVVRTSKPSKGVDSPPGSSIEKKERIAEVREAVSKIDSADLLIVDEASEVTPEMYGICLYGICSKCGTDLDKIASRRKSQRELMRKRRGK